MITKQRLYYFIRKWKIEKEKINDKFKWISYDKIKYYLNKGIKNDNDNILEN